MRVGGRVAFGTLLRRYRAAAGLSQEALAERAGLSRRGIADLERGARRSPHPETMRRLVDALALEEDDRRLLAQSATRTPDNPPSTPPSPEEPTEEKSTSVERALKAAPQLPVELTSFVGREDDLVEIRGLLAHTRLLTLFGSGGVGKTRLALRLAAGMQSDYSDGVWLVELAALTNESQVSEATAVALGIYARSGHGLEETLVDVLHSRQMLLVIDNCEHLLHACALLVDRLLSTCIRLQVLATSREPLGIAGETAWRVPNLSLPSTVDEMEHSEAVRLFVMRAKAALPSFELTNSNAPAVEQVCQRLDGIPLALELAAARVRALSVRDLADRLNDALGLLVRGSATASPRQQTLRATLEWSHALLSPREQVLFRRLSVFAGGWTLAAAETVCADLTVPRSGILDALDGLIGKSLVQADEHRGAARYRLLETIRQYAAERLIDTGEALQFRENHRAWVIRLVERTPPEAYDPATLAVLDQEQDNLRAGLRSAVDDRAAHDALRLSSNWLFWYMRGQYTEGRGWLSDALALPSTDNDAALVARALSSLGYLTYLQGDLKVAQSLLEDSLRMGNELEDASVRAVALHQLANVAKVRGELANAVALVSEALGITRKLGNVYWESLHLVVLTEVKLEMGAFDEARRLGQECLKLARGIGHTWSTARALHFLGRLAAQSDDGKMASALLEESLALQREFGNRQGLARTLTTLGRHALNEGDTAAAGQRLAEALRISSQSGERVIVATCISGIAELAADRDPLLAVRLAGAATGMWEALGALPFPEDRSSLDGVLAQLRNTMKDESFTQALHGGRNLPLDEAVATALSSLDAVAVRVQSSDEIHRKVFDDPLTVREREVAELIARGLSNREIARVLVIGEGTASNHVQHILEKLSFHTRAQIASWATLRGLHAS